KERTTQQRFRIGDRERLYSVTYRPHNPGQIAVGATRKILLLDLDRGTGPALSAPLPGSSGQTVWQTVSMDAKGTRIAASTYVRHSKDSQITPINVWMREHGRIREMPEWTLAEAVSSSLAMAPNGQYLITVDCHGSPTEWPLLEGTQPEPIHMSVAGGQNECGKQSISPVFSPDGRLLATADGKTLRLWKRGAPGAGAWSETPSDNLRRPVDNESMAPMDDRISTLGFSANSQYLAVGGKSGYVRLWKVEDGRSGGKFAQVAAADVGQRVSVLAFNPDGTKLLVGGEGAILTRWSLPTLAMDGVPDARHVRSITGAAYALDRGPGERPMHVTAGADGYVVEWTPWNNNPKNAIDLAEQGSSPVRAIALSRDGTFLVTAGDDLLGWNLAPDHVLDVAKAYADRRYREPEAKPGAGTK
ncbi:MAG: WD40 repeat domain-containing protein, partial [Edaphobacter sp.]